MRSVDVFKGFMEKPPVIYQLGAGHLFVAEEATCRHHIRTRVRPYSFANMTEILGIARSSIPYLESCRPDRLINNNVDFTLPIQLLY